MSNDINETHLINTSQVDDTIVGIANQVLAEEDPNKAKDLISIFNWNMSKKNVARILKLNELYDNVTDHMVTRLTTKSDQFTNSDLLDYMKVIQGAIDTSSKNLNQVEEPPVIVQNNTQVNINMSDQFDREAKERILAAIQATLQSATQTVVDDNTEVIEVDAEEIVEESPIESEPQELNTYNIIEDAIAELNSQLPNEGENITDEQ